MIEVHGGHFTAMKAAGKKYPKEAGGMMEYRHLVAKSKYRPIDTIVFIEKCNLPFDRWRDIT